MAEFNGKKIMLVGLKGDKGDQGPQGPQGPKGEDGGTSVVANPNVVANKPLERISVNSYTYSTGKKDKNFISFRRSTGTTGGLEIIYHESVGENEPINIIMTCRGNRDVKGIKRLIKFGSKYGNGLSKVSITKSDTITDILCKVFKMDEYIGNSPQWLENEIGQTRLRHAFRKQSFGDPEGKQWVCYVPNCTSDIFNYTSSLPNSVLRRYAINRNDRQIDFTAKTLDEAEGKAGICTVARYMLKFVRGYEEKEYGSNLVRWKGQMAREWLEVIVNQSYTVDDPDNITWAFIVRPHRF